MRRGRAKPLWKGHPWVFASSVAHISQPVCGTTEALDWVRVQDDRQQLLGAGLLSESSAIRVRLLCGHQVDAPPTPEPVLTQRIAAAVALRQRLFPDPGAIDSYRLVHAEADGLPGLVVDRHADWLVAQFATRPMWSRREQLARELLAASGARGLLSRPAGYEEREGLPLDAPPFTAGEVLPELVWIREEMLLEGDDLADVDGHASLGLAEDVQMEEVEP